MITSQNKSILYEVANGAPIPLRTLAYFRARLSNRIHALVLEEFARLENAQKLTRAQLGRRIGRKPEQITRWLGSAGNWTIDTLSDLLLGIGCEPALAITKLHEAETRKPLILKQELPSTPTDHLADERLAANDEPIRRPEMFNNNDRQQVSARSR